MGLSTYQKLHRYFRNLLLGEAIVLDEAGNVLLLEGSCRITISAHCGALFEAYAHNPTLAPPCWLCQKICGILGHWWPNHCINSWHAERLAYLSTKNLPGGGA